jgi:hypothetical protein
MNTVAGTEADHGITQTESACSMAEVMFAAWSSVRHMVKLAEIVTRKIISTSAANANRKGVR